MPYNRKLYSSSESAIDAGIVYDQTEEKLQSEINAETSSNISNLNDSIVTFVRPNLLDNWYFAGGGSQLGDGVFPINQSGQTSYSGAVASIDRWRAATASTSITLFAEYVRFTGSAQGANFFQEIKEYKQLAGKVVTLSAIVGDHVIGKTVEMPTTLPALTDQTVTLGTSLPITNYEDLQFNGYGLYMRHVANVGVVFYITAGSTYTGSLDMKGVKLEIGTTQTLAHQENGVWVLNEIPNWNEEFTKLYALRKTGGTMTGNLVLSGNNIGIYEDTTEYEVGVSPTDDFYTLGLRSRDRNQTIFGTFQSFLQSNGNVGVRMYTVKGNVGNELRLIINSDGNRSVSVTEPAVWRTAFGALSKAGDTMTGNLSINNTSSGVYLNNTNYDVTDSSYTAFNNVGLRLRDKNSKNVAIITDRYMADGKTGLWLSGWKTVGGTDINNSLHLFVDKNGNRVVEVSESAPWRTALGALNKAGDTMTGNLLISKDSPACSLRNTSMDVTSGSYSSSVSSSGMLFYDKNNVPVAHYTERYETDGSTGVMIGGNKRVNGTNTWNYLRLLTKADGTKQVIVTDPAAWRKGINLCYSANETYAHSATSLVINGLINTTNKILYLDFVTDKSMENISTVTVTAMSGTLYGVAGTMIGSATNFAASPYTVSCAKQGFHHVKITVTSSSALPNALANSPVIYFGSLSLKFT